MISNKRAACLCLLFAAVSTVPFKAHGAGNGGCEKSLPITAGPDGAQFKIMGENTEVFSYDKSTGPTDCLRSIPFSLSPNLSQKLCTGAKSAAPAFCLGALPAGVPLKDAVELCNKAESTAPAECFKAIPYKLSPGLSAKLCKRAANLEPAVCMKELPAGIPFKDAVEMCRTHFDCEGTQSAEASGPKEEKGKE